jgi:type I restriction enzyme, S subunit
VELKPGYKQTEVGVIPEAWRIASTSDIGAMRTGPFGTSLRANEYSGRDGVPLISVREIGDGCLRVDESTPLVRDSVVKRLPEYVLRGGDIVFGRKGAVERSALVSDEQAGSFLSSDGIRLRPSISCHPPFVAYQFQRRQVRDWLLQNATGSTMASMNQEILSRVHIPLAPLPEQRAIAAALSDVDALITALDQLIAKKRDLKQAAMQQLLTGQQRLPGFHGEWEVRKLADIAPLQRGFDLPNSALHQGSYPVVYSNGVLNSHSVYMAKAPGVVTGRSGTIGKVTYVEEDYWPHNTSLWVTNFKDNFPKFIYYLYVNIRLERFGTGSGVPTLNRNDVHAYQVAIPSTRKEQIAIAAVLSDMDTEIASLEQRRDKTCSLKQGMMQELLTGRTRLV